MAFTNDEDDDTHHMHAINPRRGEYAVALFGDLLYQTNYDADVMMMILTS